MEFEQVMHDVVNIFEAIGVLILVVVSFLGLARCLVSLARGRSSLETFDELRAMLGRGILLGLEILVVADIIRTIVEVPTLDSAITLGLIVLVRIGLSFAIDVEVDGVVPWRRGPSEPS
jgi:uncharacterized membrane protein